MDLPLPLIITCIIFILALIVFPLIVSFKAEKRESLEEWDKIKDYGNKINNKTRNNK